MVMSPPGSWPGTPPGIEISVSLDEGSDSQLTSSKLPEKVQHADEVGSVIKGKEPCPRSKRIHLSSQILER